MKPMNRGKGIGFGPAGPLYPAEDRSSINAPMVRQNRIQTVAAMPAFNEEKYIAKTILGARRYVDKVIVVDDGSTDDTAGIAEAMGALVIRHPVNIGYGGALKMIFDKAKEMGVEELVILDSDGQHNPEDIPKLLAPLANGADVVIGSRFLKGSMGDIPGYRKVGMKVLDGMTNIAGQTEVSDSQSGFRAYRKSAIQAVHLNGEGMSAGSQILIQLSDAHMNIEEVPIHVRYDIEGTSSQNSVSHGLGVLSSVVGIIGYRKPLVSFGVPGGACVVIGVILASIAFTQYYATAKFPYVESMASGLFVIVGLLLVTTALILNSLVQIVKMEGGNR